MVCFMGEIRPPSTACDESTDQKRSESETSKTDDKDPPIMLVRTSRPCQHQMLISTYHKQICHKWLRNDCQLTCITYGQFCFCQIAAPLFLLRLSASLAPAIKVHAITIKADIRDTVFLIVAYCYMYVHAVVHDKCVRTAHFAEDSSCLPATQHI